MCDVKIYDIGYRCDGGIQPRYVYYRIPNRIEIINAYIRIIKQVGLVGMADKVILRHLVLPVGAGYGNDLHAILLRLHHCIDGGRIDTDIVEYDQHIVLL